METPQIMETPLAGIRVIDLTNWFFAPFGTTMLAEMGADVIKVEELPAGDPARGLMHVGLYPPSEINMHTELSCRSKRSVGIDLKQDSGRAVLLDLIRVSDVFVSSIREHRLQEWGLDYRSLSRINPTLVYTHASGYGPRGPDSELPATDMAAQARSGNMNLMAERDSPLNPYGLFGMADSVGSLQLTYGVVLALYARNRTGRGQAVRVSLLGGQVIAGAPAIQALLVTGHEIERHSQCSMPNPLRNIYRTRDGRWIALTMSASDRYWDRFCPAIGREDLVNEPAYASLEKRIENRESLIRILDGVFATKTLEEWLPIGKEWDLQFAPVNTHRDILQDLQMWENGYITTVDHPTFGPLKEVGITVELSDTPGRVKSAAPEMGQHTEEVLMEVCGYSWERMEQLKEVHAIL